MNKIILLLTVCISFLSIESCTEKKRGQIDLVYLPHIESFVHLDSNQDCVTDTVSNYVIVLKYDQLDSTFFLMQKSLSDSILTQGFMEIEDSIYTGVQGILNIESGEIDTDTVHYGILHKVGNW